MESIFPEEDYHSRGVAVRKCLKSPAAISPAELVTVHWGVNKYIYVIYYFNQAN